jgi:hypothetical protein
MALPMQSEAIKHINCENGQDIRHEFTMAPSCQRRTSGIFQEKKLA